MFCLLMDNNDALYFQTKNQYDLSNWLNSIQEKLSCVKDNKYINKIEDSLNEQNKSNYRNEIKIINLGFSTINILNMSCFSEDFYILALNKYIEIEKKFIVTVSKNEFENIEKLLMFYNKVFSKAINSGLTENFQNRTSNVDNIIDVNVTKEIEENSKANESLENEKNDFNLNNLKESYYPFLFNNFYSSIL